MSLKINTNIAAMVAHKNMIRNNDGLSASLEKLSSGLRINKAADDASGMAIADSLRSQSLALGQAIRNANDGISVVQTADGALDESINIVNTIKTKAIQAAQDGQTTESRLAIQADITKLMEELDIIARSTAFNNQKLLSGNFTNKAFQIGAYSGETVSISIGSSESTKIGHLSTASLTFASEGTAELAIYSNLQDQTYNLNSVEIAYDNTRANSLGAVSDAINKLSDVLGITAKASVISSTSSNIVAGTTDDTFAINGITIGAVTVTENDSTGALVAAINQKTAQHGVFSSVDQEGNLTLTSTDDRAIEVVQGANTTAVFGGTANLSTLGEIILTQQGTGEIAVDNRGGGTAVALLDNSLATTGLTTTTIESSLASGSVIESGSTIGPGSVLTIGTATEVMSGDVFTTGSSIIGSGSVINSGSMIAANSALTGQLTASGVVTATGTMGSGSTIAALSTIGANTTLNTTSVVLLNADTANTVGSSTLARNTIIGSGTSFTAGSYFLAADMQSGDFTTAANVTTSGLYTVLTGTTTVLTGANYTLTNGSANAAEGSVIASGSSLATGSNVGANIVNVAAEVLSADMTLTTGTALATDSIFQRDTNLSAALYVDAGTQYTLAADMTLAAGSNLTHDTSFRTDTSLSDAWYNDTQISVTGGSMTLGAGSTMSSGSILAEGSSIGGTLTLAANETVDSTTDMLLAVGSVLATGSTITAGTFLTNDVVANDGNTYSAGTILGSDIVTSGATTMTKAMTLNGGSILLAGTTLAANDNATEAAAIGSTGSVQSYRLSDISVTTQAGAQIAISVADAALKNLDKVRSDLGSVQNQLTSTIANITATRVNIASAESSIRDVDFAEESSNYSKMQILAQAGTFAMAQANAISQNVLSLLQ